MSKYRLILKNGIERIIELNISNGVQKFGDAINECFDSYVMIENDLLVSTNEIALFEKIKEEN